VLLAIHRGILAGPLYQSAQFADLGMPAVQMTTKSSLVIGKRLSNMASRNSVVMMEIDMNFERIESSGKIGGKNMKVELRHSELKLERGENHDCTLWSRKLPVAHNTKHTRDMKMATAILVMSLILRRIVNILSLARRQLR
jgi:hypothetical protein